MKQKDICRETGCFPVQLSRLLTGENPVLESFAGGIRLSGGGPDAVDESEAEIALRFPGGVLCLMGAARKWDLTDLTRDQFKDTVLLPIGAWHEAARLFTVEVTRTRHEQLLTVGVLTQETAPGLFLRVTGPERTICDLFSSTRIANTTAVEAMSRYLRTEDDRDAACNRILLTAAKLGRSVAEIDIAIQATKEATTWIARP